MGASPEGGLGYLHHGFRTFMLGVLVRSVRCLSRTRQVVIWVSALVAFGGWGGALWTLDVLGPAAGGDGGFVLFIAMAISFTVVSAQSIVMPDQARIYAVGIERGRKMEAEQRRARHLSAV